MWLSPLKNYWEKLSPAGGLEGLVWIFTLPFSCVSLKGPGWLAKYIPLVFSLAAFLSGAEGKPPLLPLPFCLGDWWLYDFSSIQDAEGFTDFPPKYLFSLCFSSSLRFDISTHIFTREMRQGIAWLSSLWEFCTAAREVFSIQRLYSAPLLVSCKVCPCLQLEQISALLVYSLHLIWMVNNSPDPSLLCTFHLKMEVGY